MRDEFGDDLGTDQPGPADNDDLHDDLLLRVVARLAVQENGRPCRAAIASVELPSPAHYRWDAAPSNCRRAAGSSRRELKPSFVNTLRRWYSTVRGLIKS